MTGGRVTAGRGVPRGAARCLDAAGVTDPELRADIEHCRRLHALHGRTYYLATWLLPPDRRPWVWSLYGFFRTADELVDAVPTPDPALLRDWAAGATSSVEAARHGDARSGDPSVRALLEVLRRHDLDTALVDSFLTSMLMDLEVTGYRTYEDLLEYVEGSARVVGLMMLPVLGTRPGVPLAEAAPSAALLGEAFQLTNFVRDVGEDLDRGRLYLPAEDLAAVGLAREELEELRARALREPAGATSPPPRAVVELVELEIARCHELYDRARPGLDLLDPRTRPGVQAAFTLYGEILDRVRREVYPVLRRRVVVPGPRRAAVAAMALATAVRTHSSRR